MMRAKNGLTLIVVGERQGDERREDREVTVCEVDEPHRAERERQTGREQRVHAAEQNPLHDRIRPHHQALSLLSSSAVSSNAMSMPK